MTPTQQALEAIYIGLENLTQTSDPHLLNIYVHVGEDLKHHTSLLHALAIISGREEQFGLSFDEENEDGEAVFDEEWYSRSQFIELVNENKFNVQTH